MIAKDEPRSVSVLGRGRLGSALAGALEAAGIRVERLPGRADAPPRGATLLLAVPDDAVADVAARLAGRLPETTGRVALHLSGVLDSSALAPLAARGDAVGSCHPLQSFPPGSPPSRFSGVTFAVEGMPAARAEAARLAASLGGTAIEIAPERKALWHLAASLSANGAVALVGAALDLLAAVGLDESAARRALAPLVTTAVAEAFARGPEAALTGPVARGDRATIARHRAALLAHDAARVALFEALVREQERLVASRNRRGPAV